MKLLDFVVEPLCDLSPHAMKFRKSVFTKRSVRNTLKHFGNAPQERAPPMCLVNRQQQHCWFA